MYKFLFALSLLMVIGQTMPMIEEHSENKTYYKCVKRYYNSSDGRAEILYPERGVFKIPSRKTHLLHAAIKLNDEVKVGRMLAREGKRIVAHFDYKNCTLNFAIECGNPRIIELVRSKGSRVVILPTKVWFTLDKKQTPEQIKRLQELLFPRDTSLKSLG